MSSRILVAIDGFWLVCLVPEPAALGRIWSVES